MDEASRLHQNGSGPNKRTLLEPEDGGQALRLYCPSSGTAENFQNDQRLLQQGQYSTNHGGEKWAPFEKQILGEYCSDTDESTDEEGEDVPTSDCPGITLRNIGESKMGGERKELVARGQEAASSQDFMPKGRQNAAKAAANKEELLAPLAKKPRKSK